MLDVGRQGIEPLACYGARRLAWAAFNYNIKETLTPRGQTTATPNEINGIVDDHVQEDCDSWQAVLIHVAVTGKAITPH